MRAPRCAARIRLAAVTTAADQLLPAVLTGFLARCPQADLHLDVGSSEQVWGLLERHETDLVIAGRPPRPGPDLVVRAVRGNELVVVAAPAVAGSFAAADVGQVAVPPSS